MIGAEKGESVMSMLLALLTGAVISVMVAVNGELTACVGTYLAAVIIHIVGTIFSYLLCRVKKTPLFRREGLPLWAYLGGVIGVLTTIFNAAAFGHISMTSIVALGLLGQSVAAAFIDGFGLLGMPKRHLGKETWAGLAISGVGVAVMLDASVTAEMIAVLLSLGAGVSTVLSRTVNARLAKKAGALAGSFYNHLIGLPCCIVICLLLTDFQTAAFTMPAPWMLCGGMMGVLVVMLCNHILQKLPALRLTLLSFLGEIFTGFVIDLVRRQEISGGLLWGSILCAVGFLTTVLWQVWGEKRRKA